MREKYFMINYFGMRTVKSAVHLLEKRFRGEVGEEEGLTVEERRLLFRMVYVLNEEEAYKPEEVERIGGELVRRWMEEVGERKAEEGDSERFSSDLENFARVLEEVFSGVKSGRREQLGESLVQKNTKLPLYLRRGVSIFFFFSI